MTHNEMIEVIQAHRDGKVVECQRIVSSYSEWSRTVIPSWDFSKFRYRVKLEPAELWALKNSSGGMTILSEPPCGTFSGRLIRFREVVDE